MPTDRPCDQPVVPDSCADTGGLVSVQLNATLTAPGLSDDQHWHKNAVVFLSRRDEFSSQQQEYIQEQSKKTSGDFGACLNGQVESVLAQDMIYHLSGEDSNSAVNLTQVADCASDSIAKRLGAPPRGVFISQRDKLQLTSISAYFAVCKSPLSGCIDAPAQSFGQGHVIAHVQYQWANGGRAHAARNFFFYAVLLPPRRIYERLPEG